MIIYMGEKSPEFTNEQGNAVEFKTENADIEINYSIHTVQSNPEAIKNADAIILELVSDYRTIDDARKVAKSISEHDNQYKLIIQQAAQDGKPIFLIDISTNNLNNDITSKLVLGPIIEVLIASGLLFDESKEPKKTRRDFLRLGAKSLVAAHLSTPAITSTMGLILSASESEPNEGSLSRTIERSTRTYNNATHPELHSDVVDTRNDLLAEKTDFVAKILGKEMNKRPRLSLFVGSMHTGIEDSIKSKSSERIERLRSSLKERLSQEKFIAKIIFEPKVGDAPQKFSISIVEDSDIN